VRFLCTCERCAPRFVAKKNWRWRREMTINDLFRFERGKNEFETGKKIKKIMWSRSTYKWLRKGSVLLMVHH
jgi:hypothetical protein